MNASLFKLMTSIVLVLTIFSHFNHPALAANENQTLTKKKIYTVGFAQDTLSNDWRRAQADQLRTEFNKYPNINFIVTDASGNSSKQIRDIENLAHQKVDVLITSPRDGVASTPAISRVYKQGIPVVLITRSISTDDYTSLITPDDYLIASKAAEFIARKLSGKGNVLILTGVPSASTAKARSKGFLNTIKKYPGIKVIAIKNGNYLRSDAIRATAQVLEEGIHFDAIYAQSDSMASGARLALKKKGVSPSTKLIVGIDYIHEAREAIRSGEQSASFIYPICAYETARVVLDILHKRKVKKKINVGTQMITKDNVNLIPPIF